MCICRIYFCLFSDVIHRSVLHQVSRAWPVQSLLSSHEVALGIMCARISSKLAGGPSHPIPSCKKNTNKIDTPPAWWPGSYFFVYRGRKNCKEIADCRLPRLKTLTPTPRSLPPETPKDKPTHQLPRQDKTRRDGKKSSKTIDRMETLVYELGLPIVAKALGSARLFHSLTAATSTRPRESASCSLARAPAT